MQELESARALEADEVEYPRQTVPEFLVIPADEPPKRPWYDFLTSNRFWALILGALSVYAETKGWIGEPERNLIATITSIFITVGTIDRGAEYLAKAKN